MNNRVLALFIGIPVAAAAYLRWRRFANGSDPQLSALRNDDLYYSHLSPADLEHNHLVDLNQASEAQLNTLGLDSDSLQRLVDNRPYRSKLELVSRMIIPEAAYASIKDKVGIARGDEPVKTA